MCELRQGLPRARALSLGLPPIFLDDVGLIFQFPQRVVGRPSQTLALGLLDNGDENAGGLGVTASNGKSGFMLLNQSGATLTPLAGDPRSTQIGWGRDLGRARIGLALRGSRYDSESSNTTVSRGTTINRLAETSLRGLEGTVGLSIGDADRFVDIACGLHDREFNNSRAIVEETETSRSVERLATDTEDELAIFVAGRAGTTLDSGIRLTAVGSWAGHEPESRVSIEVDSLTHQETFADDADLWSVGLAGTRGWEETGELSVFGHFERSKATEYQMSYSSRALRTHRLTDVALLGISMQRDLWRELDVLVGARAEYMRRTSRGSGVGMPDDESSMESNSLWVREDWSDRFSWGLGYQFERFHLAGAVDSQLDLDDLFLRIDASFLF